MKYSPIVAAAALVGGLAVAAPAQADPYHFVITGDYSADFFLDSSPTPDAALAGTGFGLFDQEGFPDAWLGVADLYFWNAAIGGGMEIDDYYADLVLFSTDGSQLYSGSEDAPTFLTGTFALTQYMGNGQYTLTISGGNDTGAVPEPATWAMMVGGFGLMGAALRRRSYKQGKTQVAFAA